MKRTSLETTAIVVILLAVPLVYWPALKDYTLGPKLLIWQLVLLLGCVSAHRRSLAVGSSLFLPAAAYVFIAIGTTLWTPDRTLAVVELLKLFAGLALLRLVATRTPDDLTRCIKAAVVAASLSAILGILQYWGTAPWTIPSAGLPSGTIGFRNVAATVTIQALPFAIWLAFREPAAVWRIIPALLLGFVIQTRTRGAWLGLAASALVWIVLNRRSVLEILRSTWKPIAIAVAVGLLIGTIPSRIGNTGPQDIDEKKASVSAAIESLVSETGDRGRLTMWRKTLGMIADRPGGVGLGGWAVQYPHYDEAASVTFHGAPSKPHNDFLWITAELGILGLAVFLWMISVALRSGVFANRGGTAGMAQATITSLVAVLVHSSFSFPRYRATPTLFFWFALGILATFDRKTLTQLRARTVWAGAAATLVVSAAITDRLLAFESRLHAAAQAERHQNWPAVADLTGEALSNGRFHSEAIHLHGYAMNTLGRFEESARHYARYARYLPYDVQFLNGQAIAMQNTGDLSGAEQRYRRARGLVAASPDLDYNLATLLIQMKRPAEAVELLEQVNRPGLNDPAVLFHLGNARALSGDDIDAIDALEEAVAINAEFKQAWLILGKIYARQERHRDALSALQEFLDRSHRDDRFARRAKNMIDQLQMDLETPSDGR